MPTMWTEYHSSFTTTCGVIPYSTTDTNCFRPSHVILLFWHGQQTNRCWLKKNQRTHYKWYNHSKDRHRQYQQSINHACRENSATCRRIYRISASRTKCADTNTSRGSETADCSRPDWTCFGLSGKCWNSICTCTVERFRDDDGDDERTHCIQKSAATNHYYQHEHQYQYQ